MGTNQQYYINYGGMFHDITPDTKVTLATNPFSTVSGSPIITVLDNTNITVGTIVSFSPTGTIGGLAIGGTYEVISSRMPSTASNAVLGGTYNTLLFQATVNFTPTSSRVPAVGSTVVITGCTPTAYNGTFTVLSSTVSSVTFGLYPNPGTMTGFGSITNTFYSYGVLQTANGLPVNASSTATGGGAGVVATYRLNAVNATITLNTGWGSGQWGTGYWGGVSSTGQPNMLIPTTFVQWSQGNFGDNLVFAQNSGSLYYWTVDTTAFTPAVSMQNYANTQVKTTQTVTTGSALISTGYYSFVVANSQGIDYGAFVTGATLGGGSVVPAGTYVTASGTGATNYQGYTTVIVYDSTGTFVVQPGDTVNFSYSGYAAPPEVGQVLISSTLQFTIALGATPYNPSIAYPSYSPMLVRWADQSLPWEWTPATYNQSGEQVLSLGSYIIAGLNTRQEILIWTDRAVYSMQYIGAPFVFSFSLLMDNVSIASAYAAITVNGAVYWMGNDKFYVYNGTVSPLPCTVRKYVFSNLNNIQAAQVVCGQNEQFNEIWWFYPSQTSNVNDSYVIYNYAENLWYYGTLNRSGFQWSSLYDYPLGIFSVQTSYLSQTLSPTATSMSLLNSASYPASGTVVLGSGSSAETITYSGNIGNTLYNLGRGLNATTWNAYTTVSMSAPNQILFHESGVDDVSTGTPVAINSYLQSADFDINGGDHFGYVGRFVPDFTFVGSTAATPQITLTLNPRNAPGDYYFTSTVAAIDGTLTNTQPAPTPPNTFPVEQYTEILYTRVRGRQMNLKIQSNAVGVQWQMGTMRFDVKPDGRR